MPIAQDAADGCHPPRLAHPLALRCRCGVEIAGVGADTLVRAVNAHLVSVHPRLAGSYDADDILSLSYRRPAGKDPL